MRISGFAAALVAAIAVAAPLAAQQPRVAAPKAGAPKAGTPAPKMMVDMKGMDSLEIRLDSAVALMNRSTGDAKTAAMADVLNALVAHHKAMHAHMQDMQGHMGAMPGMGPMKPRQHAMPGMARPDSGARPPK